jgi:hypothetical protein
MARGRDAEVDDALEARTVQRQALERFIVVVVGNAVVWKRKKEYAQVPRHSFDSDSTIISDSMHVEEQKLR